MIQSPVMSLEISMGQEEITLRNFGHVPAISFVDNKKTFRQFQNSTGIDFHSRSITMEESGNTTTIGISIESGDRIYGLGEKPGELQRNRSVHEVYSKDAWNYNRKMSEIYSSFPSFIIVSDSLIEVIVNCGSRTVFDFGIRDYNGITITIPANEFELFIKWSKSFNEIMEWHSSITGKPFKLPKWVLGHQVSRWSYYPQSKVEEIRDKYLHDFPLSAIYLDIDYMDGFRVFTWDRNRFPDPERLVKETKEKGVRIIPIIDPGIKLDQNCEIYRSFLGHYVEDGNSSIFTGYVWPGLCAFPDFLNKDARSIWSEEIKRFSGIGIEGIWLDMNEPSVRLEKGPPVDSSTIDMNAVHKLDSGIPVRHEEVHNFYAYFQAMATYDALNQLVDEPFILTRSGYTGIQKYSAMWTGDNEGSYDDLKLQMNMVMSLGLSGMPYVGCDLGGFMGHSDYELLCRYYEMALFFPLYRNHKAKNGNDQELFLLPQKYRERVKAAIATRMKFAEYLAVVAEESHETGHPMVRPLFYHYYNDSETLSICDQYMLGSDLIYAPQIYLGNGTREVYIPEGSWIDFNTGQKMKEKSWIETSYRLPIYVSAYLYSKIGN